MDLHGSSAFKDVFLYAAMMGVDTYKLSEVYTILDRILYLQK